MTDCNETIIKNIFKQKKFPNIERRELCSVRNGSSVRTAVNERGEGTVVAVFHFHFMTAFQRRPKRRQVFPFPNNHRRPSKVFFSILTFLTFFSTFSIRPSIFFFYSYNPFSYFFFYF